MSQQFSSSQLFASQESVVTDGSSDSHEKNEEIESTFSQLSDSDLRKNAFEGKLLHTHLPEESLLKTKQVLANIQKKTKEAEDVSDIVRSTKVLSEQMERQDMHFKTGGINESMSLDAECFSTNAGITYELVKRFETDSKPFDPFEFATKLLTSLNPSHRVDRIESIRVDVNDWIEFGRTYCRFHKVVPTLNYIRGSFDSTVESTQQKEPKHRIKASKLVLSAQTEAIQIDQNLKTAEDSTRQEVEHILRNLKKLEVKNPSVPYIEAIVSPNSFSETVENIFHSTFLIKDGFVRSIADECDGLPVIASIDTSNIDLLQPERGIESVFSFSMKDWKFWTEKFQIKESALKRSKKN